MMDNNEKKALYAEHNVDFMTFLDAIDVSLVVTRYSNQKGRWTATIVSAEIKEGSMLCGTHGNGSYPEEAIEDYVQKIKGKLLILNAYSGSRKEILVPTTLYFS
jgi:hypothetical protein